MPSELVPTALREVLTPVRRPVSLDPDRRYETLGVRWYGNGAFVKEAKLGSHIATKTQNAVEPGDVVYSKLFAWKGSFAVVDEGCRGAVASTEFPTYTADPERLLPRYFALWASRPEVWTAADDISTGTTAGSRNRLAPDDFLDFEIDLPSLAEQQAIVAAVDVVDRVVSAGQREADASRTLLQAARETLLFADTGWDDLPPGLRTCHLADVADIRSGITKGRKTRGELAERPFIRAANVQTEHLDLSEIKTLPVTDNEAARFALAIGDVLLVEGSGSPARLGSGWLWEGQIDAPVVCQNHVFRVRPDQAQIRPEFLAHAVHATPARAYFLEAAKTTSGLATINKTQVGALEIPLPSLEVQTEISEQLTQLRRVHHACVRAAERALDLRRSLVEELVVGARPAPTLAA